MNIEMTRKNSKAEESLNKKFGRLLVVKLLNFDKFYNRKVLCICDCGKEKIATLAKLKSGDTKSCGCFRLESAMRQLEGASRKNSKLKGKSEPRIGTAKIVFARYSDGNLSFDDFLIMSQQNCFYCDVEPSNIFNHYICGDARYSPERVAQGYFTYNGLDRVSSKLPHDLDNVVPCCIRCNKAKLTQSKEEFFSWISKVYKLHCC